MVQRKKARQNNKKNKKNKSGNVSRSGGSWLKGERPADLREYMNRRRQGDHYPTFYLRYKEATKRFMDYMISETPDHVEGYRKSVNFIVVAADWMAETNFVLNPSILRDLKISIRMRSKAAKSLFGGGDDGHAHLLSCLVYCWGILSSLAQLKDAREDEDEENNENENVNRFEVLMEDDDDEDMDEEMFPSAPVPRPEPQPESAMTIVELMTADDRNDIILFFLTLDELMGVATDPFRNLKNCLSPGDMIEESMKGAVAVNMAIQLVQQLEFEIQEEHPHLTTPYRMLSSLALPGFTQNVAEIVRFHGNNPPNLEKEITIFLGDCLECQFRCRTDPTNKHDTIVNEFCTKMEINEDGAANVQYLFGVISLFVICEVPLYGDIKNISSTRTQRADFRTLTLPEGHSWLSTENMPNIAGDRSIIHTLRLLQTFTNALQDIKKQECNMIQPVRGLFGPSPWRPGTSTKIHGDLDELLMSDIFPQWAVICRHGFVGKIDEFPDENELLPLFVLVRQYVQNPTLTPSWALSFATHAMLTSILETDSIFSRSTDLYESTFNDYFTKIEMVCTELVQKNGIQVEIIRNQTFMKDMTTVFYIKRFGWDLLIKHAIYNPLWAGTTFSYISFFGNLEVGCSTLIDCQAQLKMTLHLFSALKINGIVSDGQIPFLDQLHRCFESSRGVWEGPLPQRGEMVKRIWICFGMALKNAKKMGEEAKLDVQNYSNKPRDNKLDWEKRKVNKIAPTEISTAYRRICDRDFHDVVDNQQNNKKKRQTKGTSIHPFIVRVNDTLNAIENERELLSLNLPVCSVLIEQFIYDLGEELQKIPYKDGNTTEKSIAWLENQKNKGYNAKLFSLQYLSILADLDFAHDPSHHQFVSLAAKFTAEYFNNLDPRKLMWFGADESFI